MTEIQISIIRPLGGRSILSSDNFIFSRTNTSKIFGKQCATAVHTFSKMLFQVFSANFFKAIFEK
jgi:hypothetical protein